MLQFSDEQIVSLTQWEYQFDDLEYLGTYLHPFWNMLLQYVPRWLSPNIITLCGLLVDMILIYVVVNYYTPAIIPIIIVAMFFVSTLDALDGKQARLLNHNTTFGELLDHGIDIVTMFVNIYVSLRVLGLEHQHNTATYILVNNIFFSTHVDAYRTGVVVLPKYFGPNGSMVVVYMLYILSIFIDIGSYVNEYIVVTLTVAHVIFCVAKYKIESDSNPKNIIFIQAAYLLPLTIVNGDVSLYSLLGYYICINFTIIIAKIIHHRVNTDFLIGMVVILHGHSIFGYIALMYLVYYICAIGYMTNINFLTVTTDKK
jgi:phosphatidylglycerophosphate synthase